MPNDINKGFLAIVCTESEYLGGYVNVWDTHLEALTEVTKLLKSLEPAEILIEDDLTDIKGPVVTYVHSMLTTSKAYIIDMSY